MHKQIRDWVLTIPFLVVFGLTLVVFDGFQRIARLFGLRPHGVIVGIEQFVLLGAFKLCGTRLDVDRSHQLQRWKPYIFVSNHQSLFDIPVLSALLFSHFPKYVAKKQLAQWIPSVSYFLRRGGNALIDRDDRDQALQAIRDLGERVRRGGISAVIFPEGTRARAGGLSYFLKDGLGELLGAAPDIPVVPVVIDGSWHLLKFNCWPIPFGTRVHVHIGEPMSRSRDEDREELMRRIQTYIKRKLQQWREPVEDPPKGK